jgi:hypothetical protein
MMAFVVGLYSMALCPACPQALGLNCGAFSFIERKDDEEV